jgi:hypothetical protein
MDADSLGRDRLLRVFRFLEALNQHRNPTARQIREQLWTLWVDDLPDHPTIQLGRPRRENNLKKPVPPNERDEESFILRVSRPKLTPPPDPGSELKTWFESGWEDPFKSPSVRSSRNEAGRERNTVLVKFAGVTWHTLRHTFASRLVAQGVDIVTVQQLLGHSTITVTMRYTHTNLDAKRAAVEKLLHNGCDKSVTVCTTMQQPKARLSQNHVVTLNAARS